MREVWGEIKRRVKGVLEKGCKVKEGGKKRGWWDVECKEEKRKVRGEGKEMEKGIEGEI